MRLARLAICWGSLGLCCLLTVPSLWAQSGVTVRVMAANLTSGNNQRYETPGLDILKGLKPDIVAIQEFNYASASQGVNTPAAFREMVDATFGANFVYFREAADYAIPNGIVSRYPMLASGSWADSSLSDRGFAWARIDVPGTNDLFVVSVHLKASSGSGNVAQRAAEAAALKGLIAANFPSSAWVIVAGDMNISSESEGVVATLGTFLSDRPIPADAKGDPDTNAGRSARYDRVWTSFSMTNTFVPVAMPSFVYTNGLVFDSRVYTSLADVPPVVLGDSGASQMQHMAVVKDFRFPVTATNLPALPPVLGCPALVGGQIRFLVTGSDGAVYIVQVSTNLGSLGWMPVRTNTAPFLFSEPGGASVRARFYRGLVAP